jgi:hypothetical protein
MNHGYYRCKWSLNGHFMDCYSQSLIRNVMPGMNGIDRECEEEEKQTQRLVETAPRYLLSVLENWSRLL